MQVFGKALFGHQIIKPLYDFAQHGLLRNEDNNPVALWGYTTVVDDTLPDLPKEAIKQMVAYDKVVKDLCGKRAVFYLIAEKKDQKEVSRRRDPILLAQSPFGFFWQILGAWDKEVVFLEEL